MVVMVSAYALWHRSPVFKAHPHSYVGHMKGLKYIYYRHVWLHYLPSLAYIIYPARRNTLSSVEHWVLKLKPQLSSEVPNGNVRVWRDRVLPKHIWWLGDEIALFYWTVYRDDFRRSLLFEPISISNRDSRSHLTMTFLPSKSSASASSPSSSSSSLTYMSFWTSLGLGLASKSQSSVSSDRETTRGKEIAGRL